MTKEKWQWKREQIAALRRNKEEAKSRIFLLFIGAIFRGSYALYPLLPIRIALAVQSNRLDTIPDDLSQCIDYVL